MAYSDSGQAATNAISKLMIAHSAGVTVDILSSAAALLQTIGRTWHFGRYSFPVPLRVGG